MALDLREIDTAKDTRSVGSDFVLDNRSQAKSGRDPDDGGNIARERAFYEQR